ncbi:cell wall hydrolase/autolysin [Thalassoporum mexicanum PCC 7367]|uniref:N-acetylmuramoyl-L-alanine amidase n=1 Tax=Thalassoporum mexicanum TaxID=3457544 RepID=UPI00029FC519|nr:N-acetylmuramoyl-L-alanine amidase [Pseudanabaena sp. PCC 7367]AFY69657.1 cell wall hydrolase/autolysin [Pseudanabaena sp. PCC 7367]
MAKIFLSAGHGGFEGAFRDPGVVVNNTSEAAEMIATRDLVVAELRSRGLSVEAPSDDLSLTGTISWINARASRRDVALEIHGNAAADRSANGTEDFYIAGNQERKRHGELLIASLLRRVPELRNRGAKPDTAAAVGRLAFCRDIIPPSLLLELCFLSNPSDLRLLQTRRRDFAIGIADGLQLWLRDVSGVTPTPTPTPIPTPSPTPGPTPTPTPRPTPTPGPTIPIFSEVNISLNGRVYPEKAIIVTGNAYVPIDLVDSLGIDLSQDFNIRRLRYRNIVYAIAIGLRDYGVSVNWEPRTRTVEIKTIFSVCPGQLDQIMGQGNTSEVQMLMFLKNNNEAAITTYEEMPRYYREEGSIEGVNYDIAFSQMCLETNFLRFGGDVRPAQNNFAGLGAVGGNEEGATFPDQRTGVRAHIQHLKAYGSTSPLVQELVNPRFHFVQRGIAPLVNQLSGRWAVDPNYGSKIIAIIRRLYESANIF